MNSLKSVLFLMLMAIFISSCSLFGGFDKISVAGAAATVVGESLSMVAGNTVTSDTNPATTEDCTNGGTVKITVDTDAHTITEVFVNCKLKDLEMVNCTGKTEIETNGSLVISGATSPYNIKGKVKLLTNGNEKECDIDLDASSDGSVSGSACGEELTNSDFVDKTKEDYCSVFGLDPAK